MEHSEERKSFILPFSIITRSDISKLIYEIDSINNFFMQAEARQPGTSILPPRTTPEMEDILRQNKLNLIKPEDRVRLKNILETLRTKSPIIHMSFSVSPNRRFLESIISWLRKNINPLIILQVGLQPNIGAGFTLRTTNHFFDFSLRQRLNKKSDVLVNEIRKAVSGGQPKA